MTWLVLALLHLPPLVAAARPGVGGSRRLLATVLVVALPVVGALLALIVRRARGGADPARRALDDAAPPRRTPVEVRRLAAAPSLLDRITSDDPDERRAALAMVTLAPERASVAIVRWAVERGAREVALDAALALEELDLRSSARMAAALRAVAATPTFEHAVAAGDAAADAVLTGVAVAASAPPLIARARAWYRRAAALAPERAPELLERRVRLELAAGDPAAALAILDGAGARPGLDALREAAAFATRRFDRLAAPPRLADPDRDN